MFNALPKEQSLGYLDVQEYSVCVSHVFPSVISCIAVIQMERVPASTSETEAVTKHSRTASKDKETIDQTSSLTDQIH